MTAKVAPLGDMSEPVLFEVYEIARLVGWERRRMLRLLRDEMGIATRLGARWVVGVDDLRERFPQAHRELLKRREKQGRPRKATAAAESHGGHG